MLIRLIRFADIARNIYFNLMEQVAEATLSLTLEENIKQQIDSVCRDIYRSTGKWMQFTCQSKYSAMGVNMIYPYLTKFRIGPHVCSRLTKWCYISILFAFHLSLFSKIKGNVSEIFAGNLYSYYLGVWIQRTVPEANKYAIFAFQSGCIQPQETENWYNPDTQITFK